MSKSTYFTGQPVFAQVLKMIDRAKVEQISNETTESELYVKKLDGYTRLVTMLFWVLRHYDSLRELEIGLKAEVHKFQHLGIDYVAKRSTLSEANMRRTSRVLRTGVCLPSGALQAIFSGQPSKKRRKGLGENAIHDGLHHYNSL